MKSCWNCGSSVPESYRYCLNCGADTNAESPEEPADPLIGSTVAGKFLIEASIGSGAMGTIYRAVQTSLSKTIVIKVLHSHLLGDPELSARFHREAKAASLLNHPNCVQIIDFGQTDNGSLYIAMEYIQGLDLADLLERDYPIEHRRLVGITKQICLALDEAHANGVLHRDLKPENVMVEDRRTQKDFVRVVDFGIAKLEDRNPNSSRSFRTRTGIVCGTPEYMSPEQARGIQLDARSDLYALGVCLYHLVTDRLPFDAPSPIEIVTKHLSEAPIPPIELRSDLPKSLNRLILTLLEKDRVQRPMNAMDVHAELERIERELASKPTGRQGFADATVVDLSPIQVDTIRPGVVNAQTSPTQQGGEKSVRALRTQKTVAVNQLSEEDIRKYSSASGPDAKIHPTQAMSASDYDDNDLSKSGPPWVWILAIVALLGIGVAAFFAVNS